MRLLVFLFVSLSALHVCGAEPELIASPEAGWPQFRGPRRDGISIEKHLLGDWPKDGPKLLWTARDIGHGFSSPVISGSRMYITGDFGDKLRIMALDFSGNVVWTATNGAAWKEQFPGARASVTYSEFNVFHENAHGVMSAFDAATGKRQWSVDLLKEFGGENITWGLSECLLVDERAVYATAGGSKGLMVALNKKSGELIWKSESMNDSAGYASPIFVKFGDRRLIIGCSLRHLFCVDAANGELQWTYAMPTTYSVLALTPTLVGDAVFMTAPHGNGGKLLKLIAPKNANEKVGTEVVWTSPLETCQGGVVAKDGKIFGAFYQGRKGWTALDAKTGKSLYVKSDFVKGCATFADERIYALSEDGWMRLLEPTEIEFKQHGEFRLVKANGDAWAHPVIHDGKLFLRYHDTLFCYDIKK